jgi:hypothetical protein
MLETFATVRFPDEAIRFQEAITFAKEYDGVDFQLMTSTPQLFANVSMGLVVWLNTDFERHRKILENYAGRLAPILNPQDSRGINPEQLGVNFVDPVEDVSRSFTSLFSAIQKRENLIPSERLSELSRLAANRLGEAIGDVETWAKKLVSDTRGADD